jgi:hypothetical protein
MGRVRCLAATLALAAAACGGNGRPDYGPLDPVAASFGLACDMGRAVAATCGALPNDCFAISTGSVLPSGGVPASALLFCARWCKDGCPSGTFCPNPDRAKIESLFSGACFRACARDEDCAAGTICDPSVGSGGCIPSCSSGHTVCDNKNASVCEANGHCSGVQPQ